MAFSYDITRAPTSALSTRTAGSTLTSSAEFTRYTSAGANGVGTTSQVSVYGTSEMTLSKEFYGTAGAWRSYNVGTNSSSIWTTWLLEHSTQRDAKTSSSVEAISQILGLIGSQLSLYRLATSSSTGSTVNAENETGFGSEASSGSSQTVSSTQEQTSNTAFATQLTFTETSATSFTDSGAFPIVQTILLTTASTSTATTLTQTVSTTATASFRKYSTHSSSGMSSTSSSYSLNTSTTRSTTATTSTKQTTSQTGRPLIDRLVVADSSDWLWSVTQIATSKGRVSEIASSITGATIQQIASASAISTWVPVTVTWTESLKRGLAPTTSSFLSYEVTQTEWRSSQTTSTVTVKTNAVSTYVVGNAGAGGASLPLPASKTISRSYSTTTTRSMSFVTLTSETWGEEVSATLTAVLFYQALTNEVVTSMSIAPYTSMQAYTRSSISASNEPELYNETRSTSSFFSNATSTISSSSLSVRGHTYETVSRNESNQDKDNSTYDLGRLVFSAGSTARLTHDVPAVAGGFQVGTFSAGVSYGTNVSVGPGSAVASFFEVFPKITLGVLAGSETDTITVLGTVNNALSRHDSTGAPFIGGFGWQRSSTDRSQITNTAGAHRYTSRNSTNGTTTGVTTWNLTSSTLDVSHSRAIATETVPLIEPQTTFGATGPCYPLVTFSAYPLS